MKAGDQERQFLRFVLRYLELPNNTPSQDISMRLLELSKKDMDELYARWNLERDAD